MKSILLLFTFFMTPLFLYAQDWEAIAEDAIPTNQRPYSLKFTEDGSIWACSSNEFSQNGNFEPYAYRSVDDGYSWEALPFNNTSFVAIDIAPIDSLNAFVAALNNQESQLLQTTDGGQTWFQNLSFKESMIPFFVHFFDDNHGFIAGADSLYFAQYALTEDGGDSWIYLGGEDWEVPLGTSLPSFDSTEFYNTSYSMINSAYDVEDDIIVLPKLNGNYWISTDKGYNWVRKETPFAAMDRFATTVAVKDENTLMFVGDQTSDSLGNWVDLVFPKSFATTDGGVTWIEGNPTVNAAVSEFIEGSDSTFILCGQYDGAPFFTEIGTQISNDLGQTWTTINDTRILTANFDDEGRGIGALGDLSAIGNFVENGKFFEIIFDFSTSTFVFEDEDIFQLYPNPVANFLTIEISEQLGGNNLNFEIISLDGRLVKTWKSIVMEKIEIDVHDLPKGLYVLKIEGTDKIVSKKIIKE